MSDRTVEATIHPHLAFDGDCREAMTWYQKALGGELTFRTYAEMPFDVPETHRDRIIHAELHNGSLALFGADTVPGQGLKPENGTAISLTIASKNLEEAQSLFDGLAAEGNVLMKLEPAVWGGTFGMLTDRYGKMWMIYCETGGE